MDTKTRVATDAVSAESSADDDAENDPYPGIDTNGVDLDEFERFVMSMQADFIADMEALDGSEDRGFGLDAWVRGEPGSGFGVTRVLEGGDVFEKAAANVSIIRGVLTPERAKAMSSRGRDCVDPAGGQPYSAAALSIVIHPKSPMVPTFRADVRRFTVAGTSWFGGGADLTPYYLFEEDARDFHAHWRSVCDAHDPTVLTEASGSTAGTEPRKEETEPKKKAAGSSRVCSTEETSHRIRRARPMRSRLKPPASKAVSSTRCASGGATTTSTYPRARSTAAWVGSSSTTFSHHQTSHWRTTRRRYPPPGSLEVITLQL